MSLGIACGNDPAEWFLSVSLDHSRNLSQYQQKLSRLEAVADVHGASKDSDFSGASP